MSTGRPTPDSKPNPSPPAAAQPVRPEARDAGPETAAATDRFRDAVQARQGDDAEAETAVWQGGSRPRPCSATGCWPAWSPSCCWWQSSFSAPDKPYFWLAWLVISALLWGWFGCLLAYRKLTCKYQLTTQRFVHERGLLKRITDRIEVIDIDDVSLEQRVIERVVGVGTIKLLSSDRSHPVLTCAASKRPRTWPR